ncbi:hypothetical protein AB837_00388 [bacterium AB1]|nr:hypothetical protein AB837_00388 [bacterium AB1]
MNIVYLLVFNNVIGAFFSSITHLMVWYFISDVYFIYSATAFVELLFSVSRVVAFKIYNVNFVKIYYYFNIVLFMLLVAEFSFILALYYKSIVFFYIAAITNRIFYGKFSGFRDYLMLRESYISNLNIPLIKNLKVIGVFPMVFVSYFALTDSINIKNSFLLYSVLIVFFVFSLINKFLILLSFKKYLNNDHKNINLVSLSQKNIKQTDSSNYNIIMNVVIITFICTNMIFFYNDQLIYKMLSISSGVGVYKQIGQILLTSIVAYFFSNSIYSVIALPIFLSISYVFFYTQNLFLIKFGVILFACCMSLNSCFGILLVRKIFVYNVLYFMYITTLCEAMRLLGTFILKYVEMYFQERTFIIYSIINVMYTILILYIYNKKKK